MSCILHHRDVQLILAYSWASPAVLAAVKGREGKKSLSSAELFFRMVKVNFSYASKQNCQSM